MGRSKAPAEVAHALCSESIAFAAGQRDRTRKVGAYVDRAGRDIIADEKDLAAALAVIDMNLAHHQQRPAFRNVEDAVRLGGLRDALRRLMTRCTHERCDLTAAHHEVLDVVHAHDLYRERLRTMNVAIGRGASLDEADAAAEIAMRARRQDAA